MLEYVKKVDTKNNFIVMHLEGVMQTFIYAIRRSLPNGIMINTILTEAIRMTIPFYTQIIFCHSCLRMQRNT